MRMRVTFSQCILLTAGALMSSSAFSALEPARLFSDHMVMQREKANTVWGWSEPGAPLKLCLEQQCFDTTVGDTGAWEVELPPREAGGPFRISISSGIEAVNIEDVYFGDVWLAGGQSNMEWKLNNGIDDLELEYADSDYPLIRFFEVENRFSHQQQEKLQQGEWSPASRSAAENFSAVAWLFAKQNHREKNVAVGIIDNNWGGTPAEAWVSRQGLSGIPEYGDRTEQTYSQAGDMDRLLAENKRATEEKYERLENPEAAKSSGAHRFDYDDSGWARLDIKGEQRFEDVVWLRRSFQLDQAPATGATLELGDLVQDAFIFVNEEIVAQENWKAHGSRHELPANLLRKGENLVAIRLANSWNNRPALGKWEVMYLELDGRRIPLEEGWAWSNTVEPPLPLERRFAHDPGFLYNAMIHPIRRYGMRGVIWYQGESNVGEAPLYGDLFKGLVRDWRSNTGQELPFLFVQLAGFEAYYFPQPDSMWAQLRHQQSLALALPQTGMATAFDIGEEDDVHPRNKQDVANRLWLQAQSVVFGDDVVAGAPAVADFRLAGEQVELIFSGAPGELRVRGEESTVQGFILAGEDGVYHAAEARLEGNIVRVSSDAVASPRALKYAWNDFPKVNLYGEAGLPVLPFAIEALNRE